MGYEFMGRCLVIMGYGIINFALVIKSMKVHICTLKLFIVHISKKI